jgi:hypothetical protein
MAQNFGPLLLLNMSTAAYRHSLYWFIKPLVDES